MKKIYRFGVGLLLGGTGLYLVALFLLYFFQEKLLFHPQVLEQGYKFTFTDAFEEVYIPVGDDVKLHGLLFKAKDSKGLVFYLHGNGGCVDGWGDGASNFTSAGYDLFYAGLSRLREKRGTIESEAQINEDIEKAFAYMEKDYEPSNIIIAGYSIGTGPATHLAAKKKVKALILQAPYYSLTELSGEKVPLIPEFVKRYKFNTGSEIVKVNAPIYIFHGTEDKLIPYEHSLKLKKKAGDHAVLIPLPGEGHNAINESDLLKKSYLAYSKIYEKLHCIVLLVSGFGYGQAAYKGTIDKYPIELVTHVYSDGPVNALYAYTKHDTPIIINGELKNRTLTLFETNKAGDTIANFSFQYFDTHADIIHGLWKGNGKQLEVRLQKNFDLSEDEINSQWYNRLLLMSGSTAKYYFKEELIREKDDWTSRVTAVHVYEKGTDKLVQRIPVDCQLWGINAIQVSDFNFDGLEDFSVFEQSYTGANTSSLYFLFDKKTGKFFNSGFEGTSLDFDQDKKLVYEHNSCCMNTSVMNATYKVVNNKLVVIEKKCLEYDEATGDYKEINCD